MHVTACPLWPFCVCTFRRAFFRAVSFDFCITANVGPFLKKRGACRWFRFSYFSLFVALSVFGVVFRWPRFARRGGFVFSIFSTFYSQLEKCTRGT